MNTTASNQKWVVWDWNGTLFDDLTCCVEVTNALLAEYALPPLTSVSAYRDIFRFPVADYYGDLGFDTGSEGNFAEAAVRFLELYRPPAASCDLHAGAREVLAQLQGMGVGQVVISASEQSVLDTQVRPFGLDKWIERALGLADIYAVSKAANAAGWIAEKDLDPADVLFVGDSEHDFEIARELGARCVLFSGGHQARPRLDALGAPVIDHLRQVPRYATRR